MLAVGGAQQRPRSGWRTRIPPPAASSRAFRCRRRTTSTPRFRRPSEAGAGGGGRRRRSGSRNRRGGLVRTARRVRGDQPVQLPRDGAVLVLAVRRRDGELLDREAVGAGSSGDAARDGAGPEGRVSRRRREPRPWGEG